MWCSTTAKVPTTTAAAMAATLCHCTGRNRRRAKHDGRGNTDRYLSHWSRSIRQRGDIQQFAQHLRIDLSQVAIRGR
jgi:hypothetical protein